MSGGEDGRVKWPDDMRERCGHCRRYLAKLVQLFGQDNADRVVNAAVDREAAFKRLYDHVVEGSQTKMRDAAEKLVAVRDGKGGAGVSAIVGTVGGPTAMAAQAALEGGKAIKGAMDTAADIARNDDIAKLLLSRGPEMDAIFEVLGRNARGQQAAQSSSEAVDRITQALMSEGYRGGKADAPYAQRAARSVASRF